MSNVDDPTEDGGGVRPVREEMERRAGQSEGIDAMRYVRESLDRELGGRTRA
jgi:hypothetical protein